MNEWLIGRENGEEGTVWIGVSLGSEKNKYTRETSSKTTDPSPIVMRVHFETNRLE